MKTKIVFEVGKKREAEAIADALRPDNRQAPKAMTITTRSNASRVVTEIEFHGRIETLMLTIDDLLKCALTAERTLESVLRNPTPGR